MRLKETLELFDRELEFPTDHADAVDAVGEVSLEAPNGCDVTIEEVLARSETTEFNSPNELHQTVANYVGDAFVGRKFYDDRGTQSQIRDEPESF